MQNVYKSGFLPTRAAFAYVVCPIPFSYLVHTYLRFPSLQLPATSWRTFNFIFLCSGLSLLYKNSYCFTILISIVIDASSIIPVIDDVSINIDNTVSVYKHLYNSVYLYE